MKEVLSKTIRDLTWPPHFPVPIAYLFGKPTCMLSSYAFPIRPILLPTSYSYPKTVARAGFWPKGASPATSSRSSSNTWRQRVRIWWKTPLLSRIQCTARSNHLSSNSADYDVGKMQDSFLCTTFITGIFFALLSILPSRTLRHNLSWLRNNFICAYIRDDWINSFSLAQFDNIGLTTNCPNVHL